MTGTDTTEPWSAARVANILISAERSRQPPKR